MKVLIWIHRRDVINNKITDYSLTKPSDKEWLQVSISQDEFTQLEDKPTDIDYRSDSWKVDQYNRNRSMDERIESIDDISDQDNQPFAD